VWMGAGTHAPQCPRGPPWQRAAATAWWKVNDRNRDRFTKKRGLDQVGGTGETGQAHGATNLKASTTPVTGGEARRWNSGSGPG
jgi:hypothetical protein